MLAAMPLVILLLFRLRVRRPAPRRARRARGRHAYLDYALPGLLLITLGSAVQGTAIMVATDMTGGIIDRFRTMAIARGAVLTGHVIGSMIQTLLAVGVLIGVAFGLGFHSGGACWTGWPRSASWPCSRSRWSGWP
jgi:ABC-2 type transport system permease protein